LIPPSSGAGNEKTGDDGGSGGGGGGGGCFITTAAGKSQKLSINPLAFMLLLNFGLAGFAGIRRKLKK
jgi:hypothetical protein